MANLLLYTTKTMLTTVVSMAGAAATAAAAAAGVGAAVTATVTATVTAGQYSKLGNLDFQSFGKSRGHESTSLNSAFNAATPPSAAATTTTTMRLLTTNANETVTASTIAIRRAVRRVASAMSENSESWSPWELMATVKSAIATAFTTPTTTATPSLSSSSLALSSTYSQELPSIYDVDDMSETSLLNDGGDGSESGIGLGLGAVAGGGIIDFSSVKGLTPFEILLNTTSRILANTTHGTEMPTAAILNGSSFDDIAATETPYIPYVMRPETYIVPILFAFIFIVGVLGNGTLIVVFLGVRQMRNVPNTYILSLALADLLVIVTTVPLTSTVYTVDSWPWGSFLCTLSEFIKDVSIGVSVFTLTALSGDRYFAIVDPLRKFHAHGGGKRATRMTIAIAISIWILAIICGLPALLGTYIKKIDINSNKSFSLCYPFPQEWGYEYAKTMVMLRFLVYYALPLIIIGVFYVLIARHLMYSANVPGEMQGAVRQVRARRKVAVTVLAFVVIFGICFLPYHVFMLWFYYWPTAQKDYNSFWHILRIVGFCLSFANSCANPVALYFVSGAFRKHFNRYLFCQGSGVRHKKRHNGDTLCMHRDTSLTSTASKRYASRRSFQQQSTIRSRLQETTTTTMFANGNHNGDNSDLALANDYYQSSQHHREEMRLM